jgi:hypothetical protein
MVKRHSGLVKIGSIVGEIYATWLLKPYQLDCMDSTSKAAVNSISEVLFMELRPCAPSYVKSNISCLLPIYASQGPDAMPGRYFVDALRENPPRLYVDFALYVAVIFIIDVCLL